MTKEQIGQVEKGMILRLLIALARQREGEAVELTPCGTGKSIEDGFSINEVGNGSKVYVLWYNVGVDTHAVRLLTDLKAE
jgi:hypothetical protein